MKKKLRRILFSSVIVLAVSAFLYVHFALLGADPTHLAELPGEMASDSQSYLPDWKLILQIGEAIRDLFIHAA